jgi:hypothetical protein
MDWSLGVGGGGALDLVMQLQGLDFKGAVDWLMQHVDQNSSFQPAAMRATPPSLRLPTPEPRRLDQVRDYLT